MILDALDWIGAAFVVIAMWAAVQFEGEQTEYRDDADQANGKGPSANGPHRALQRKKDSRLGDPTHLRNRFA